MFRSSLKSLLARRVRLILSAVSIVFGVAFVTGSFVFTDTLERAFQGLSSGAFGDVVVRADARAAAEAGGGGGAGDGSGGGGSGGGQGGDGGGGGANAANLTVPATVLGSMAGLPGAARADGRIVNYGTFVVGRDGKIVGGKGAPGIAIDYSTAPASGGVEFGTVRLGRWPSAADEVVLDVATAERAGYVIGEKVPLITAGQRARVEARLVGTATFGGGGLIGASLVVVDKDWAQALFQGGRDVYNAIWVTATPGVSQAQLKQAAIAALPAQGYVVETGEESAARAANRIATIIGFINDILLVFAAIALVVGGFIIVNTFAILVAQRSRELALLRALGASRRQVTSTVLIEALVVAVLGSAAGLGLGVLLALGIKAVFSRAGIDLSETALVFLPRTPIAAFAVGLIVTLVSAYLPARRAGRIPPVAAMRDDVALAEGGLRWRLAVGVLLLLTGGGLAGYALLAADDRQATILGVGALLVLLGAALTSPVVGRPVIAGLGRLYRRSSGAVGLLADQNTRRNPRRTAATASALMIGVALVSMMSVLGASMKATVDQAISRDVIADFVIASAVGNVPFSPSIATSIADIDGVQSVTRVRSASMTVNGERKTVLGLDTATFPEVARTRLQVGRWSDLTPQAIAISNEMSESANMPLGSAWDVVYAGQKTRLTITVVYLKDAVVTSDYVLSLGGFDALGVPPSERALYVVAAPGADKVAVQRSADRVLVDLPTVTAQNQTQLADAQHAQIDRLLSIVYALLGLAVIIAILGIVNTLALSVVERTRELGLLRAVGMARTQVRTMVRLESVTIAVLGAVLGVVLGLAFGIAIRSSLREDGLEVLAIPGWQLAFFVVVAAAVGVAAAVIPGRRAAKVDILRAIASE